MELVEHYQGKLNEWYKSDVRACLTEIRKYV